MGAEILIENQCGVHRRSNKSYLRGSAALVRGVDLMGFPSGRAIRSNRPLKTRSSQPDAMRVPNGPA